MYPYALVLDGGDGSVVVGNSGSQAFRWTLGDGMTSLLG